MPKVLDKCVKKVQQEGKPEDEAYAICVTSTGYKRTKNGWKKTNETLPSYKEFLAESPNYSKKVKEYMSRAMIPITDKISDLLGFGSTETAFHVTTLDHLKDLKKLEGKKKTISAFTYGLNKLLHGGLTRDPDIMVKLKGTVTLDFGGDGFTNPDTQGRRWFDATTVLHSEGIFLKEAILNPVIDEMTQLINPDVLHQKMGITTQDGIEKIKLNMSSNSALFLQFFDLLDNKSKSKTIKFYMDNLVRILNKPMYSRLINKKLNKTKDSNHGYNELVMNNIKILGIYGLDYNQFKTSKERGAEMIKDAGFKYLGFIPKEEFTNVNTDNF